MILRAQIIDFSVIERGSELVSVNLYQVLKDLYSCIFNIIRLGTKHKKPYQMTHTQFTGKGSDKGLSVYR